MVLALTGIVSADQVVPAVPETQGLVTGTVASVDGLVMETDAASWSISTGGIPLSGNDPVMANYPGYNISFWESYQEFLDDYNAFLHFFPTGHLQDYLESYINAENVSHVTDAQTLLNWAQTQGGLHDPPLYDREVRYTTAYDATIVAQAGQTSFTKSMNLDTRNKVIGQSNLNAQTGLTFIATSDGGNVVGTENLLVDGTGNPTNASDRILCPFSAANGDIIPAYCNIVQAGSTYDLTVGSVTTSANDRFIGTDATNPVVLNYAVNVKPYGTTAGQIPAMGSTMAYIKAHIQEARTANSTPGIAPFPTTFNITGPSQKVEDLTYNEQSGAQGTISSFSKVIAYQSGKALL